MKAAIALSASIWSAAAALALHERRVAKNAARAAPLSDGPRVSVIVPARNEARGVGAAVDSILRQDHTELELIVVDDRSDDETAARARAAAGDDPRATVVTGAPLPEGWVGKSWAAWQGFERARGEWLLFTDADVVHRRDCLSRSLGLARDLGGGITLVPRIEVGTHTEAVVLPAAFAMIATFVAPGPLVRSPRSGTAMAAGGFMLMPRADYERVGGHRAIRGRMVDDVSMAERLKAIGRPLRMVDGVELARLRMYDGPADMWRGWRKNASFGAQDPMRAIAGSGLVAAAALAGPIGTLAGLARRDRATALLGGAAWIAQMATARINARSVAGSPVHAVGFPLGVAFIAAAAWRGAADRLSGRGAVWRGRRYPTLG